jgi:hypothetical protein
LSTALPRRGSGQPALGRIVFRDWNVACAGSRRQARFGRRCERRGRGWRRRAWEPRSTQNTPIVDGLVSEVRIISRRHGLFGQVLPIVGLRSARGPKFVMVRLPDGRRRSIPRSITNLATEPFTQVHDSVEQSLRISVRTLLPLAHFLTARSTSLEEIGDERAVSPDADALDHAGSGAVGAESTPAPALEEALRDRQAAGSLRRRRHGQADGGKRSRGAT